MSFYLHSGDSSVRIVGFGSVVANQMTKKDSSWDPSLLVADSSESSNDLHMKMAEPADKDHQPVATIVDSAVTIHAPTNLDLSRPTAIPAFGSDKVTLTFEYFTFNNPEAVKDLSLFLRIAFRSVVWTTSSLPPLSAGSRVEEIGAVFEHDVSFSCLVYDFLRIDVMASGTFGSKLISRTRLNLRHLADDGMFSSRSLTLWPYKQFDERDYVGLTNLARPDPKEEPLGTLEMTAAFSFAGRAMAYRKSNHPFHLQYHLSDPELALLRAKVAPVSFLKPTELKATTLMPPSSERAEVESIGSHGQSALGDPKQPDLRRGPTLSSRVNTTLSVKAPANLLFTKERNKEGLKEANQTLSSLFRDGFDHNNLFKTFRTVITKLYSRIWRPLTGNKSTITSEMLREAMHFHRWSTAAYGSLLLAHQAGRNWFKDAWRLNSDPKAAAEFLGLQTGELLLFHKDGNDFYDPQYLVGLDRTTDSLVLACRGTFDIMSSLTDLASDVCLFKDGSAHLGWLRSAMLVFNREFSRMKKWIQAHKPRNLMFAGHSYGAAVASLLTILFYDHLEELRKLSGHGAEFGIKCHIYGAPPVVSLNISHRFKDIIFAWEHEDDNVCSISMGAMYDMRDLIALADFHLAKKSSETVMLQDLQKLRLKLLGDAEKNPKLCVPGTVIYLYQRVDPGKKRESSVDKRIYEVEESMPENFYELIPHQLVEPHFPHSYAAALCKALETVEGKGYGKDGRLAKSTAEYWRDPYQGRTSSGDQWSTLEAIMVAAGGVIDPKTGRCNCVGCEAEYGVKV